VIGSREAREELDNHLVLFYTGIRRSASAILSKQREDTEKKVDVLRRMRDLSGEMAKVLRTGRRLADFDDWATFGNCHSGWSRRDPRSSMWEDGILWPSRS